MIEILNTLKSLLPASGSRSVLFVTLHRSGSSFCERHLLPKLSGLRHIDYASRIYHGKNPIIKFNTKGFIYGPTRVSAYPKSPVYSKVVRHIFDDGFLTDFKIIFFVRDPRCRLLSSYRAFGFTHELSENKKIIILQSSERSAIKKLDISEYIHKNIKKNILYYENLINLSKKSEQFTFLRYEDMLYRWDEFIKRLRSIVELSVESENELKKKIRLPKTHKKYNYEEGDSWAAGYDVSPKTINYVNSGFFHILDYLGYK